MYKQYKDRDGYFFAHKLDWAMLALLIAYAFSLINAVDIHAAIMGLMRFAACVLAFWICYRAALEDSGYKALIYSLYLTGVAMALFAVLVYCAITPYQNVDLYRLSGTFEYANTVGVYAGVIFLLGWGLALTVQNRITRIGIAGSNAVLLLVLAGSLSRGAFLLFPIAVIVYFITVKREQRLQALMALIIAAIPGILGANLLLSSGPKPISCIYLLLTFLLAVCMHWGIEYFINRININFSLKKLSIGIASGVLILVLSGVLFLPIIKSGIPGGSLSRLTSISLQEHNLQLRIMFSHDAFEIVKDHPIIGIGSGGWNALYHQYARQLYWSDNTHNYFLQTWVETGTIGLLALLAIWLVFCQLLWKHRRRGDDNESASFWGAAVACFYLGAHSIIDLNMAFSAIAFLLFGLMGALKGRAEKAIDEPIPTASANSRKNKKGPKHVREKRSQWKSKVIPGMTLASISAFVLFIYAACLVTASVNYQKVTKIMNQNPNQGIVYLNQAIQFDSLNADYWSTAASYYVALFRATNCLQDFNLAIADCKKAEELSPYAIPILNNINKSYEELGEYDKCIEVADKLTRINPWDPNGYASLANFQFMGGISSMIKQQQLQQADQYWLAATQTADRVPANITVSPVGLNCTSGQALLLLGRKDEGELFLRKMLTVPKGYSEQVDFFRKNARLWLIASLENSGNLDEAGKLMQDIPQADRAGAKTTVNTFKSYINTAASLRAKNHQ
ncbi:MAG: O-antigen ligase family protein [Syntrophomonas sp.]